MDTNNGNGRTAARSVNVGQTERMVSMAAGAALVGLGLMRRSRAGLGMAMAGGMMLYRGIGGNCALYRALGIDHAAGEETVGQLGVKIQREIQVDEPAEKVYAFWRDFRNLPIVMPNLDSVQVVSDTRSHWRVKGPAGSTFEWDAEIVNDEPGKLIAWETLPGARVTHAGSVNFTPRPGGGTTVRVEMQYDPPGGELAHMVGRMFGADPGPRIEEDLERLRDAMTRASQDRDGMQEPTASALGYESRPRLDDR